MSEPLSGRELDAAVHRALGLKPEHQWSVVNSYGCVCTECNERLYLPISDDIQACQGKHYSTDENHRRVILAAVAERGLQYEFTKALGTALGTSGSCNAHWLYVDATVEQLCRAFLEVVGEQQ